MNKINVLIVCALLMIISGCGSNPDSKSADICSGDPAGSGSAKLVVHRSESLESEMAYGKIKTYKVTITGPGIEEPIEAEFSGDAEDGTINGIPKGAERLIKVTAINQNDKLIREGESTPVEVSPGKVSEVEVELDAVPIFVNLTDGNVVSSTRIRFELFADPEDPLQIEEVVDETGNVLMDIVTNEDELYPDVDTGLVLMVPSEMSAGERKFRVSSLRTGKSSEVTLKIIDGANLHAAPLYSAGLVGIVGDYINVARAGSAAHAPVKSGAVWPSFLSALLNEL